MKKVNLKILRFTLRKLERYLVIMMVVMVIMIVGIAWLSQKISQTNKQIVVLQQQALPTAATIDADTVRELSDKASLLAAYLPDEFNLYQVINLIEQIGRKTNFQIQSYSLTYTEGAPDQLNMQTLSLQGSGNLDQFMAFLKEYKFITGKLLTIDSVNLSGSKRLLTNLTVNIYAYKPTISLNGATIPPITELDRKLVQKIVQYAEIASETKTDDQYEPKTNPFE